MGAATPWSALAPQQQASLGQPLGVNPVSIPLNTVGVQTMASLLPSPVASASAITTTTTANVTNVAAPPTANMRGLNNLVNAAQNKSHAAVLQGFSAQNKQSNAAQCVIGQLPPNNNIGSKRAAASPRNSHSAHSGHSNHGGHSSSKSERRSAPKQPSFDHLALSRRLKDEYGHQRTVWAQAEQNDDAFGRMDRPLVEALLLPKHRPQILEYEQKIIDFLVSDDWSYQFPPHLSSFNRLLLHRLSETFGLEHVVRRVDD